MRFAQKFIKIYIKIEQILVIPPTGCLKKKTQWRRRLY